MSTEYTPADKIPDEEFEKIPLNREPSSIRDLQYLYGYFNQLGQDTSDWPVDKEYIPYLTPEEGEELVDGHRNLVFLDFKIDPNTEAVKIIGASVETLDQWYLNRVGYSHYYPGQSVDHSITLKTGENTPKQVAYYQTPRIPESWTQQEGVIEAIEDHEGRWLVEGIADIADTAHFGGIQDDINRILRNKVPGEKETTDSKKYLISVRFTQASTKDCSDLSRIEWSYPVDMPVLLDAMANRRMNKWATKNKSNSKGRGACYVLGGEDRTLYGMATDPMYLYTGNKKAWMPRLNRDESSATHPISGEAAKYIEHSQPLMEAASRTVNGGRLYQLPYIEGEQTTNSLRTLYKILHEQKRAKKNNPNGGYNSSIDAFYRAVKNDPENTEEIADRLKFWTLFIVSEHASLKQAMSESRGTKILHHVNMAEEAVNTAREMKNAGQFDLHEDMEFADPSANHLKRVSSLEYFLKTTVNTPAENGSINSNSPALTYYNHIFNGEKINLSDLLQQYVAKIGERYDPDDEYPLPEWLILEQFAQILTLDRSGLLNIDVSTEENSIDEGIYTHTETTNMPSNSDNRAETIAKAESNAFTQFITDHELLKNNKERRAAFTLGALISTVAQYQKTNGKNPITRRISPKSITKRNFQSRTTDIIELVNKYSSAEGRVMRYRTLTSRLCDDLSHDTPDNWNLKNEDIQYHVALGMSFGAEYHGPEQEQPSEE